MANARFLNNDKQQNAEYLSEAMTLHPPHPTRKWSFCPDDTLASFMHKLRQTKPYYFELDAMCTGSLGFHLFKRHVKEHREDMIYMDFLTDVAAYRNAPNGTRTNAAGRILYSFLLDGFSGSLGRKSVLLEQYTDRNLSPEAVVKNDVLPDPNATNALKISGESLNDIFASTGVPRSIADWDAANLSATSAATEPNGDLFDSLDIAVFSYLKGKYMESFKESDNYFKFFRIIEHSAHPVTLNDFNLLRALGRGGFGTVKACKHKQTGKMLAAKIMSKKRIKLVDSSDLILEERVVMSMVDSPFVVCLKYAFATPTDLYLILDLMTGGDLGYHLGKRGKFSSEESRFFAARTLMGIKALHDLDIVYRDIKPENILLDDQGYSRLSDFGLACRMRKHGLSEACGTRGYWAPEMLRRDTDGHKEKYFLAVDWFSLGCIIYEFHNGVGPFRTDAARKWGASEQKLSKEETMDLATLQMQPEFDPEIFDASAMDLISKLMVKNPAERLGANGPSEIMSHPYFETLDFAHLDYTRPPYRPPKNINAAKQSEIGKFNTRETDHVVWSPEDDEQYNEWEFINITHYQREVVEFMRYEEVLGKQIEPVNETPRTSCRSS